MRKSNYGLAIKSKLDAPRTEPRTTSPTKKVAGKVERETSGRGGGELGGGGREMLENKLFVRLSARRFQFGGYDGGPTKNKVQPITRYTL